MEDIKDEMRKEADQFSELLLGSRMLQPHEHDQPVDIHSEVDLQFGSVLSRLFKEQLFVQTYCLSIETGDHSQMQ
jgi:hypothetical protein